jgi:hypothetical protein
MPGSRRLQPRTRCDVSAPSVSEDGHKPLCVRDTRAPDTIGMTAERTGSSPTKVSTPSRSLDERQVAVFIYAAYAQDIELSHPSERPGIRTRVAAIRTPRGARLRRKPGLHCLKGRTARVAECVAGR